MKNRIAAVMMGLLLSVGCSKETAKSEPQKSEPQKSELQKSETTSSNEKSEKPPTPAVDVTPKAPDCVLDGDYRVQFESNGVNGWWFRFNVEGAKASLQSPVPMLSLSKGDDVALKLDVAHCGIVLTAKGGDVVFDLKVDAKTHAVVGTLARAKKTKPAEKNSPVEGVHDGKGAESHATCFVPGIYKLAFDEKSKWVNAEEDDDRDCSKPKHFLTPVVFRLEPYRGGIAITSHETYEPFEQGWPGATASLDGDCKVTIATDAEGFTLKAKLTLTADGISGIATNANYQIVEDGDDGENIWDCKATDVPLSGKRM